MERTHLKRRLTAVLLADVVGYSRLMGRDEEDTHRRLARLLDEIVMPRIAQYGGRPIRSMGDGLLVEFDSAFNAVRCGLEIQRELAAADSAAARDPPIRLRIGINTGDVIFDERDIYGNSVNIAARLEQLAEPGEVYVSAGVYDQLRGYPDLSFTDRGYRRVKNIDHPIRVFRVAEVQPPAHGRGWIARLRPPIAFLRSHALYASLAGLIVAGTVGVTTFPVWRYYLPPWQRASLLVLPFKTLGNDPEQGYIADAVTDDLTTDLSRLRKTVVIASTTAFTFKGKTVNTQQIGRDIGVRYLVEGSIGRVGTRVRTNARLIEADSGVQLWADRFESEFPDLLKLEDTITGRIANALDIALIRAEGRRAETVAQPTALDLRLRAESLFLGAITPEHALAAQRLLEQAVRLDPNAAVAWAWLANITISQYLSRWNGAGPERLRQAGEAVERALALDPNLALAHLTNGFVRRARGEHQAALAAFSRAIELDPNYARAYAQKGNELVHAGQPGEAPPLIEQAIRLSPRDPLLGEFYWIIGRAYFYMGRYDQAIPWLRQAVELRSNVWYNR
ncbi:MAG TPA: tetratricopeptide repeat protein, partial [Stellaceae bacterium]|nr:tetratricopeptide repeat protein [Stellaceae bacterium]